MTEESSLSRRERERLAHRRLILDVALKFFTEFGYHRVSMHKIAKKAEFAIGTVYRFFPNKEELFRAMILEFTEKANAALLKSLEIPGDELAKILNFVQVKGEILAENESILKLYIGRTHGASMDLTACLNEDLRLLYEKVLVKLASVLEEGITAGRLKSLLDPYYLAVSLSSITSAFLLLRLRDPERHPYLEHSLTMVAFIMNNLENA